MSPLVALEIIEKDLGYQEYVKKRGNEANLEKGSDDIRDLKVVAKPFSNRRLLPRPCRPYDSHGPGG